MTDWLTCTSLCSAFCSRERRCATSGAAVAAHPATPRSNAPSAESSMDEAAAPKPGTERPDATVGAHLRRAACVGWG